MFSGHCAFAPSSFAHFATFVVTSVSLATMSTASRISRLNRRAALAWILGAIFLAPIMVRGDAQQDENKRKPVESSVLASVGYDAGKRVLEIEFHSGAIYRYLEVPEEIHRRLLAAESKGHFFGANIRDKFRSERVKPRTAK